MKKRLILFFLFIFFFTIRSVSQTTGGVPGYVRVPTATFNPDGTLVLGSGFLPQKYLEYTKYTYDAISVYAGLTFLSFVEIDLRVTRILGLPSGSSHVVDRVPSIRIRILKEKKWIPAVTVGAQDFITSLESGVARHFGASYLVVTKNFHIPKLLLNIEATAGYGSNWLLWKNNELVGPFGGMSIYHDKLKWMILLFDYDGITTNAGIRMVCFNHLVLMAGTMNFNTLTGGISYRFCLKR